MPRLLRPGLFLAAAVGVVAAGFLLPGFEEALPGPGGPKPRHVETGPHGLVVDGEAMPLLPCVGFQPVDVGLSPDHGYRFAAHPSAYLADLDRVRELGARVLLVYVTAGPGEDGLRPFLDAAWAKRLSVFLVVPGPNELDSADPAVRAEFLARAEAAARAYRDHPAVLLWLLGNEVDYEYRGSNVEDWFRLFDEAAARVRALDPHHPVVFTANPDSSPEHVVTAVPAIQVFGINFYGLSEDMMTAYVRSLAGRVGARPLLLTEFGADAWDDTRRAPAEEAQASALVSAWRGLAAAREAGAPLLAACVHEWTDQWWKDGDPSSQNPRASWPAPKRGIVPGDNFSEEWFGLAAIGPEPGERRLRPAYEALAAAWRG